MYFVYRGYSHPAGEVQVTSYDARKVYNDKFLATSIVYTMQLSGIIVAAGDAAIDARVAEIQNAYSLDGGDAALMLTNGSPSSMRLDSGSSMYGVRVVDGPRFPMERNAAHYATGLPFEITLQAEYTSASLGVNDAFVGSSESIEMIGDGGPITAITVLDNGPPVADTVSPASPVIVTQAGEAVYELPAALSPVYPNFNPPIWPQNLIRPDGFRVGRHKTRPKGGRVQYKATWSFNFHFTEPPFIPNPAV